MTIQHDTSCEARVDKAMESTLDDLRKLWEAYCDGDEDRYSEDLGNIFEYGLCFDYVAPETFSDQKIGYFRYQLSWGGPSEEFRIYTDASFNAHIIEFWFLDWWDGAFRHLTGEDFDLIDEIFEDLFKGTGVAQTVYNEATEY